MKIGVFDSGIGGLSVLHYALRAVPGGQFIYYADSCHVPYGEKTREQIVGFVDGIIRFLIGKGAKAVVIACNTATSAAVDEMRARYTLPIIGMEPAVKKAVDLYGGKRVLVAATPVTVSGQKMQDLLERVDKEHLVDLLALPELVKFAEMGEFESPAVTEYLRGELGRFALSEYASLVLGCTHFNYFKDTLRALLPDSVRFVDGIEGTINNLTSSLEVSAGPEGEGRRAEYYDSGRAVTEPAELARLETYMDRLDRMILIR
jgi:glutamate racemase